LRVPDNFRFGVNSHGHFAFIGKKRFRVFGIACTSLIACGGAGSVREVVLTGWPASEESLPIDGCQRAHGAARIDHSLQRRGAEGDRVGSAGWSSFT
jgi:hypothetical protein